MRSLLFSKFFKRFFSGQEPVSVPDLEFMIERSEVVLPNGKIAKSLFLDYCFEPEFIFSKILRHERLNYEEKKAITQVLSKQEKKDKGLIDPSLPFFSLN